MDQSNFNQFLNFDKMITPKFIIYIFVISFVIDIILGLFLVFTGFSQESFLLFFLGIGTLVIGPLFSRIYSEELLVKFKIFEELKSISEKLEKSID